MFLCFLKISNCFTRSSIHCLRKSASEIPPPSAPAPPPQPSACYSGQCHGSTSLRGARGAFSTKEPLQFVTLFGTTRLTRGKPPGYLVSPSNFTKAIKITLKVIRIVSVNGFEQKSEYIIVGWLKIVLTNCL